MKPWVGRRWHWLAGLVKVADVLYHAYEYKDMVQHVDEVAGETSWVVVQIAVVAWVIVRLSVGLSL